MALFSFILTIFIMLVGPIKIIPAFAGLTQGADDRFKKGLAWRAALISTAVVAFVALAGGTLLAKYHISINALRIAGGLVLLLAALRTIFPQGETAPRGAGNPTALQLAVSPLATPIIVPPAGIAAILIFSMLGPEVPGIRLAVGIALAIVMVLDYLAMRFTDRIARMMGVMLTLQVLGAVLIFMQVGIAVESVLIALRHLGIIPA